MDTKKILVFERSPVGRLISCSATFASAALVFTYIAENPTDLNALAMAGLITLFLATLLHAVLQYGDHIYFSEQGLMYENRLFSWFGKRGRWMRWEDIVEVREVREKVLVLLARDGHRVLVDAIIGYAIARAEILRRAPQAILSGTLARSEQ